MKIDINKGLLFLILFLIFIGSNVFAVVYYLGLDVDGRITVRIIHFFINILITIFFIVYLGITKKIPYTAPLTIFIILLTFTFVNSVWQSTPQEYLPTLFRFFNYVATFVLGYNLIKKLGSAKVLRLTIGAFQIFALSIIFWGFLEIYLDNIVFLNGAKRISAGFKFHPLAFSMFSFAVLSLLIPISTLYRKHRVLNIILVGLVIYLFINSHSRLLTVGLVITYLTIFFYKVRYYYRIGVIILAIGIGYSSYYAVINYDISPRLKELLVSDAAFEDSSTKARVELFNKSIDGMSTKDYILGQGIGGFHNFYLELSGKSGVAAHNNILLFLVEGGIIGLFLYIVFELLLFIKLVPTLTKRNLDISSKILLISAASLFLGLEVFGLLLNNLYFYQSEIIAWLFFGFSYSIFNRENLQSINRQ